MNEDQKIQLEKLKLDIGKNLQEGIIEKKEALIKIPSNQARASLLREALSLKCLVTVLPVARDPKPLPAIGGPPSLPMTPNPGTVAIVVTGAIIAVRGVITPVIRRSRDDWRTNREPKAEATSIIRPSPCQG